MSDLAQPILIANSGYHVGHQMSIRVAEEQGFFAEEGLTRYEYDWKGLIPGPLEREGLALVMKEHGVDIAPAVNVESLVMQRRRGADLAIVGGWRMTPRNRIVGAKRLRGIGDLRGARIGIRETGGLAYRVIANALNKAGIDPARDVTWVCDRRFAYGNDPEVVNLLRTGQLDAMACHGSQCEELQAEGYPLLLDTHQLYPGGRPGRVIVAPRRTIEERGDELRAFLRANIRAFWFVRDPANFDYLADLEARRRRESHNDDERNLRIISSPERLEGWVMPATGGVPRAGLAQVIDEMVAVDEIERPVPVAELLQDGPAVEAYAEVSRRPALQGAWKRAMEAVEKHGY